MFILRSTAACFALFAALNVLHAQGRPQQEAGPQKTKAEVDPQLWKVLSDWEQGSSSIKRLEGRHQRRVYDDTFKVEEISQGMFYYEGPDKGRIDVERVKISQKMLDQRNDPNFKVERDAEGKPYQLKSDEPEQWVCDGSRVFDIDTERKEARIANLPPNLRGKNIMNSPLPFLFGLPPAKALERFDMKIVDTRPNYVLLEALPLWRQDAQNWKRAEIFLSTENYLPLAVKMLDPAETKRTVYTFFDPKINKIKFIGMLAGKKPFEPDLRDYKINVITDPAQQGNVAKETPQPKARGPVVPNVIGQAHHIAEKMLLEAGVPKQNIKKLKGKPAPQKALTYQVSKQSPQPGTPLKKETVVQLLIFTAAQQASAIQPTSGTVSRNN